jgi:hypothetical protein
MNLLVSEGTDLVSGDFHHGDGHSTKASKFNLVGMAVFNALAFDSSGNLYAGGAFKQAGTNLAGYVAKALFSTASYDLTLTDLGAGTNVISAKGTPGYDYALDFATNLARPINWMPQATNTTISLNLVFTNVSAYPEGFYRMRYVP